MTHVAILYADRRKLPGVPGAAMAIFADRRSWGIKSPIRWNVRYQRLNSPAFAKCARSRDFYAHRCESPPAKVNQSDWAI